MKVNGQIMLFKNDFGYSTSISNKKQDGTYENMAMVVQFRKDDMDAQKIPTKTKIDIKDGFLSFYHATNGEKRLKVVVLDYDIVNSLASDYGEDINAIEDISQDDLPF